MCLSIPENWVVKIPETLEYCPGIQEARLKFLADMVMIYRKRRIIIPSEQEWIGINLLERDGEL